jgi:hypothetical protein
MNTCDVIGSGDDRGGREPQPVETTMASLQEKYEMRLMVLTDLAATCRLQ